MAATYKGKGKARMEPLSSSDEDEDPLAMFEMKTSLRGLGTHCNLPIAVGLYQQAERIRNEMRLSSRIIRSTRKKTRMGRRRKRRRRQRKGSPRRHFLNGLEATRMGKVIVGDRIRGAVPRADDQERGASSCMCPLPLPFTSYQKQDRQE